MQKNCLYGLMQLEDWEKSRAIQLSLTFMLGISSLMHPWMRTVGGRIVLYATKSNM